MPTVFCVSFDLAASTLNMPTILNSAHCFHSFAIVSRNDAVDIITGSVIDVVSGSISPYSLGEITRTITAD